MNKTNDFKNLFSFSLNNRFCILFYKIKKKGDTKLKQIWQNAYARVDYAKDSSLVLKIVNFYWLMIFICMQISSLEWIEIHTHANPIQYLWKEKRISLSLKISRETIKMFYIGTIMVIIEYNLPLFMIKLKYLV